MKKHIKPRCRLPGLTFQQKKRAGHLSGRYFCAGGIILLLGAGDLLFRLANDLLEDSVGIMLRMGYEVECLIAGVAILIGGGLLLDYVECQADRSHE